MIEKSDASLIELIRHGNDDAATGLYHRYSGRIMGLVQSQMGELLKSSTEPDDIVQSIFKSVFRGMVSGAYVAPEGQTIWQLLAVISINKVRRKARSQLADRRDARRNVSNEQLDDVTVNLSEHEIELHVREVLDRLDAADRSIVDLRLMGCSVEEIAEKTQRSRRTVERSLQRIRSHLSELLELELS